MLMHVRAKKIATAGLLAAMAVVLLILAAVVETSSLFFIATASFCVGIVVRKWGVRYGAAFLVASASVGFLAAPNKMYCLTFVGMGIYLLGSELIWRLVASSEKLKHRRTMLWIGKYVLFNAMYLPVLIFFPKLLIAKRMTGLLFLGAFAAGQVGLFFYDVAHNYVQSIIWKKFSIEI